MKLPDPPLPDTSQIPPIIGETLAEVIYSRSHRVRGVITVDTNGIYRVRIDFWDTSNWESEGVAFWNPGHLGTFTDSLLNARKLCREHILALQEPEN